MSNVDPSSVYEGSAEFLQRGQHLLKWVCAIDTGLSERGSGLLIGPNLVLTNYHVIESLLTAPKGVIARCRFDFLADPTGEENDPSRWVSFAADWRLEASKASDADRKGAKTGYKGDELDYAIVMLAESVGMQPVDTTSAVEAPLRGWLPLPGNANMPAPGTTVHVFQHPMQIPSAMGGRQEVLPQKVTPGAVIEYLDGDLRMRHTATTFKGSSGAPVFDSKFQLVALHNSGDKTLDIAAPAAWNQAIPIVAIVRHLRARGQESLIGRQPPQSQARANVRVDISARAQEGAEDAVSQRVWAASILLNRDGVEGLIRTSRKGDRSIVHVLACRHVDKHQNFLKRLSLLSIDGGLDVRDSRRRAFVGKGTIEPAWQDHSVDWLANRSEQEALKYVKNLLSEIAELPGRVIAKAIVDIDLVNIGRERRMIAAITEHCRSISDADRLQFFVVYHDPSGLHTELRRNLSLLWEPQEARGRLAGWLGSLWGTHKRPSGFGVSVSLEDVGSPELDDWCKALQDGWEVADGKLPSIVSDAFAGDPTKKMPILDVQTRIEPGLRKMISARI